MLEELVKSLKATLYDRTISPLFGTFVVSWALWNYRLIVVLLSDMSVQASFQYIDEVLYPSWPRIFVMLFGGPLLTAVTFIYLYPWPARKTFEFARNKQRQLIELRQRIDKESLVSKEVWEEAQRGFAKQTAEHARSLEEQAQLAEDAQRERDALRTLHAHAQSQIATMRPMLEKAQLEASRMTSKLIEPLTDLQLAGRTIRFFLRPEQGLSGSRLMELGTSGLVVRGQTATEHRWTFRADVLTFRDEKDAVTHEFTYEAHWQAFVQKQEVVAAANTRPTFILVEAGTAVAMPGTR